MKKKLKYPPQPLAKLISGHYFDFYSNQLQFLTDAARNFGDLVYLRFFHIPIYLLNDPVLIEQVLAKAKLKKPKTVRSPLQRQIFGNGLLTSEDDFWLKQRRLLQQAFDQQHLAHYFKNIVNSAEEFLNKWQEGEDRVINDEFVDLTLEIAAKTFFGIDDLSEKNIVRELTESLKIIFSSQSRYAWFFDNYLPTKNNLEFKKSIRAADQLIDKIIQERRKNVSTKNDLLSVLLSLSDDLNSEKQIRDEILTFFIAGHETTAITLMWIWVLLSKHEDAAKKLQSEINTLGADELTFGNLSKLSFTNQIIKETLRMFPPNRSVAREVKEPFRIDNFEISKGSQLIMSQWVLHRDSKYFESPDNFKPERWTLKFEQDLHKYAYFPFGLGNRICIGRSFAIMEITLILITLAKKFRFNLVSNERIEPLPVILLRPKNEIHITVSKL